MESSILFCKTKPCGDAVVPVGHSLKKGERRTLPNPPPPPPAALKTFQSQSLGSRRSMFFQPEIRRLDTHTLSLLSSPWAFQHACTGSGSSSNSPPLMLLCIPIIPSTTLGSSVTENHFVCTTVSGGPGGVWVKPSSRALEAPPLCVCVATLFQPEIKCLMRDVPTIHRCPTLRGRLHEYRFL